VSVPSRLPLFEGLALGVYKLLGDPLFDVLTKASQASGREKVLNDANLSPDKRVEANLFFDRQYDRLFSALEKRIDPDLRGRTKTRKVRRAVEDILSGNTYSPSHYDLLQLSQAPNSSGDRSRRLSCRIVTTNFDLLFEGAWQALFGKEPISFDARMAPRPGAHNFDGIIHLHGSLTDNPSLLGNYVLSSRDFARVYLRSGVIGNYVYDLIRRYRVVLVGYSADDPPMRYLMDAIGEDASLFDDMRKPIAITDLPVGPDDPSAAIEVAIWLSKEIKPIFYTRASGQAPYDPLWKSIHEWANWSRDEAAWVERQLERNTRIRREDATPFQRGLVQDLLAVLSADELEKAVIFLSTKKVDFKWIETVSAAIDAAKPGKGGTLGQ
jgi:hypothetical protein